MYGDSLNQVQFQNSFYAVFDPEIQTVVENFVAEPGIHKKLKKEFPKFSSTYLLDSLELNTKSRCVFCWSGKNLNSRINPF